MDDINEDLRETIPFDQLAARLGASREEVEQATELALPALLQGMNANAHRSQEEASSLLGALIKDHDGSMLDAEDPVGRVDPYEGRKIVGHVFGDRTDGVVNRLGAKTGGNALMENLLPMLAPIVMAWLSRKMGGAVSSRGETPAPSGGLGDILGGMIRPQPGVVDHDVEATEMADDPIDSRPDTRHRAHIHLDGHALAAAGLDLAGNPIERRLIAGRQGNPSSGTRQRPGQVGTDSSTRSRHQGGLSIKSIVGVLHGLSVAHEPTT